MTAKERDCIIATIKSELKDAVANMKSKDFGSAQIEFEDIEYLAHRLKEACEQNPI